MAINTRLAALTARFLLCPEEWYVLEQAFDLRRARHKGAVQPDRVLYWIARHGLIDALCAFTRYDIRSNRARICEIAAEYGQLRFLMQISRMDLMPTHHLIITAAAHGHLAIIKWLHRSGHRQVERLLMTAIIGGHMHVFQWALANGYDPTAACLHYAAANGRMDILEWLVLNSDRIVDTTDRIYIFDKAVVGAVYGGQTTVLDWLKDKGIARWRRPLCSIARRYLRVGVLQWLKSNQCCRCNGEYHPAG
ncbi:MAG: ankyrin repeat domain-containing protein [Patescibacteria group bacterium]|nr:ankyrin repeat domain-containing protein [Patescibacteria group bacterium]